jgi:hypothetical protein
VILEVHHEITGLLGLCRAKTRTLL